MHHVQKGNATRIIKLWFSFHIPRMGVQRVWSKHSTFGLSLKDTDFFFYFIFSLHKYYKMLKQKFQANERQVCRGEPQHCFFRY